MTTLQCPSCKSATPLNAPRLIAGKWVAMCGECLTEHRLEASTGNVFLPMRFRLAKTASKGAVLGVLLHKQVPPT
jgi:hypothetical protein